MRPASVAILALYPDAGHLVPLLRMGRMLMTRYHAAVRCLVPLECIPLAAMFELPCVPIGQALSPTAQNASRQFTAGTILTGSFDVYHYDYYAAIFARAADMVATMLDDLRSHPPDVLLVDNHKFSDVFLGIGTELDRPVLFHDSTGGLQSRARRLTVSVYGKALPLWKEAGVMAAGGIYHLGRHAARLYRFRRHGLGASTSTAKGALERLLTRRPLKLHDDHLSTAAGRPSAASREMKHHIATGLGLLEHRVRGLAPHPDRSMFGPILDFPELPMTPDLQRWLDQQAHRSVVYVSFGSMVTVARARLQLLASAFAGTGPPVLWVLDHDSPLRAPGCLPANVRVESVVPQATVLAHSALGACVTHGGCGTITESLAAGVPMVVMPLMWDQPYNAQFVHDLGAGVRCDWWGLTGTAFEATLRQVLHGHGFRDRACEIAKELRAGDGSAKVAALIESLAQAGTRKAHADAVSSRIAW
jgi:hypothetical protein